MKTPLAWKPPKLKLPKNLPSRSEYLAQSKGQKILGERDQ